MRTFIRLSLLTAVIVAASAAPASAGTFVFTSNHCAFEPGCNSGYEIYTASDSGGSATRITSNDCGDGGSAWSPNGRRIAVSRRLRSAGPTSPCSVANIWLMNADGSGATALTTGAFDE